MTLSIRVKMFSLVAVVIIALGIALGVYLPRSQIAREERALEAKAVSFTRMITEHTRSALAFDDAETAREAFDSAAVDRDVVYLGLYRDGGSLLYAQGQGDKPASPWAENIVVEDGPDRVRVRGPVVSAEGPRGMLVVDLSKAEIHAKGARVPTTLLLCGLGLLLIGSIAAWVVGASFAGRIGRVTAHSTAIAAGDLSLPALADPSRDEIGQMARAFDTMVAGLRALTSEISTAGELIDSSCELFADMARSEESRAGASEFSSSMLAGLTELRGYTVQLKDVLAAFTGVGPVGVVPSSQHAAPLAGALASEKS